MGLEDVVSMENTSRRQSSSLKNFLKGLTLASALGFGVLGQPSYAGPNNNEITANASTPQLTAEQREQLYQQAMTAGRTEFSQHNYQNAVQQFTQALEVKPNDISALNDRAAAYTGLSDYQHAIEDAEHCLRFDPSRAASYFTLGVAKFETAVQRNDQNLAQNAFHNFYISKEIGYALSLTDHNNQLGQALPTYLRRARQTFPRLDTAEATNKITRNEQDTIARQLYGEHQYAASHYFFRQVLNADATDDRGREAARYIQRLEQRMNRAGIQAITLATTGYQQNK